MVGRVIGDVLGLRETFRELETCYETQRGKHKALRKTLRRKRRDISVSLKPLDQVGSKKLEKVVTRRQPRNLKKQAPEPETSAREARLTSATRKKERGPRNLRGREQHDLANVFNSSLGGKGPPKSELICS